MRLPKTRVAAHHRLTLAFVLFIAGCTATPDHTPSADIASAPPLWVAHPERLYSEQSYLTAVGSAENVEQAKRNARGNLAQIFSTDIKAQQILSTHTKGDELEQFMLRSVKSSTTETISAIAIGPTWENPENGHFEALAYLDKHAYAELLDDTIEQKWRQFETLRMASLPTTNSGAFSAARNSFYQLHIGNDILRAKRHYHIVDPYAKHHDAIQIDPLAISTLVHEHLARIKVCAGMSSQDTLEAVAINERVIRALETLGWAWTLQINEDTPLQTENPCLKFSLTSLLSPVEERGGWYFQTLTLDWTLHIADAPTLADTLHYEVSSVDPKRLTMRLTDQINARLTDNLLTHIFKFPTE